ncbi:hypothetical protein GWI33_003173 [Rhynchophorus ferrugineus]|uniref:DMA domain-containing protein n=1 Tax=Rhynchophorus ferrugineus TaxID=354439 RepID=A0A834MLE6_RHYFE|nr:hypothetical protein GWI33_003173 [Rhynchophorus ferrugineus]
MHSERNSSPVRVAAKRSRTTPEDSESDQEEAHQISKSPITTSAVSSQPPLSICPSPELVASPDDDLDVEEDDTHSETPENLSLKRDKASPEPPSHPAESFVSYHHPFAQFPPHLQTQPSPQRSPVNILMRVFPGRRRSDVEAILQRCRGDVLQAMELMIGGVSEEPTTPSAFSPLGVPYHLQRYSPPRRFLSAPYAGTGYLSSVIRPPSEYMSMMGQLHHDTTASSPASNTSSDKTSYSE